MCTLINVYTRNLFSVRLMLYRILINVIEESFDVYAD